MSNAVIETDLESIEKLVKDYKNGIFDAFEKIVYSLDLSKFLNNSFNTFSPNNNTSYTHDIIYSGFLLGLEEAIRSWCNEDSFIDHAIPLIKKTIKQELIFDRGGKKTSEGWRTKSLDEDSTGYRLIDIIGKNQTCEYFLDATQSFLYFSRKNPLDIRVLHMICTEGLLEKDISRRLGINSVDVRESIKRLNNSLEGFLYSCKRPDARDLEKLINQYLTRETSLRTPKSNRFFPIPTDILMVSYQRFLENRKKGRAYNPIQVYDSYSREIIRKVLKSIDENEKSLKRALQQRGFRELIKRTPIREILKDLDPKRFQRYPVTKYKLGEESVDLLIRRYKDFLYNEIKGYAEAERLNSREKKALSLVRYLKKEKRLSLKMINFGISIHAISSSLGERSYRGFILKCDKLTGDNLFDRSERFFVPTWLIRERGMWEMGEESKRLVASSLQDILWDYEGTSPEFKGYRAAEEKKDRKTMVQILKNFLRKESNLSAYLDSRGAQKIFYALEDVFPEKRSKSKKALFLIYDKYFNLRLFDRSEKFYVPHWLIRERNQWSRGEESVKLGLEAIQDVLWEVEGYREVESTGDKFLQLKTLDEKLFKRFPNLGEWFEHMGLGPIMDYLIDERGINGIRVQRSPYELLRLYDSNMRFGWFDESSYPLIKRTSNKRLFIDYGVESINK